MRSSTVPMACCTDVMWARPASSLCMSHLKIASGFVVRRYHWWCSSLTTMREMACIAIPAIASLKKVARGTL
eukprot:m.15573 g.15573  ORF g.15573 m.15573 type:complete len:72 (+) comp8698_c0_seq1:132-347(+)